MLQVWFKKAILFTAGLVQQSYVVGCGSCSEKRGFAASLVQESYVGCCRSFSVKILLFDAGLFQKIYIVCFRSCSESSIVLLLVLFRRTLLFPAGLVPQSRVVF